MVNPTYELRLVCYWYVDNVPVCAYYHVHEYADHQQLSCMQAVELISKLSKTAAATRHSVGSISIHNGIRSSYPAQ